MDKETLSNYGWIVICVLVLAVMIALATPFGAFVSNAVSSTAQGLFDVNKGALDAAGIAIGDLTLGDAIAIVVDTPLSADKSKPTIVDGTITINGVVKSGKGISSFKLNGTDVTLSEDGTWATTITLNKGVLTELKFEAVSGAGNEAVDTRYVKFMNQQEIYLTSTTAERHLGINRDTTEAYIPYQYEYDGTYYTVVGFSWSLRDYDYPNLKKLVIDDGFTGKVGQGMFQNNSIIETVILSKNTSGIDQAAFATCANLTTVEINWDKITYLGDFAFADSPKIQLGDVVLNENIKSIPGNTFRGVDGITSLVMTDNVTSIGNGAFSNCELLKSVKMSKNIKSIGRHAFNGCYLLEDVTLPEGLTTIGEAAFMNCKAFKNIVVPSTITSLPNDVFYQCGNLESITLPNTLKTIGNYAFNRCEKLQSITIPEGVTSLGTGVFSYCWGLKVINLPGTLTEFPNSSPFGQLEDIEKIVFNGTLEQWNNISKSGYWINNYTGHSIILQCTDGSLTIANGTQM